MAARRLRANELDQPKTRLGFFGGLLLILTLLFCMIPLILMLMDSFKASGDLMTLNLNLGAPLSLRNYASVFAATGFLSSLTNSVIVAILVTALTVICGATAAYSFTRFTSVGTRPLSNAILICRMIPSVVMGIPMYIVGQRLGLQDTYFMLVIAITTFALPFQIWMLIGFYAQIPKSLDESARIDGCSYYQAFWHIVTPSAAPGLSATAIMTFFFSWNELFFALIFCGNRTKTAPLTIMEFMGYRTFDWGAILAAGVILMVPTLLVGLVFKRYMVSGLTAGAVKG